MTFDKNQLKLEKELKSRLDWYFTLQDKTLKQIKLAPGHSIGEWSRIDAVEFDNANAEVSRLSEEIQLDVNRYYQEESE